MQNLYSTIKNGKKVWVVGFTNPITKKVERRFFASKTDATNYRNSKIEARKLEVSWLSDLEPERLQDIKHALDILPAGRTLVDSVKRAWEYSSDISLASTLDEFKEIKKAKHAAGKLCKKEYENICARIKDFKETFKSFDELNPVVLLAYLKGKGRNKTVQNWRGTIGEFLKYCVRKDIINKDPLSKIHKDSFIKDETPHKIGILSVEKTTEFMRILEERYPDRVAFYALALFAGIRIAEIPRMKPEYFRFKERQIVFPAQIGKVKKSWVFEDLPDNLWAWLEAYPPANLKALNHKTRTRLGKEHGYPYDFTRHSFSTYHLSLYFDFARTARITRNSEQTLKDHYFEKLVAKDVAKKYFEILPAAGQVAITGAESEVQCPLLVDRGIEKA